MRRALVMPLLTGLMMLPAVPGGGPTCPETPQTELSRARGERPQTLLLLSASVAVLTTALAPVHASCRVMRSRHTRSSRRAGCRMKPQRAYHYHTSSTSTFTTTVKTAPATPT